MTTEIKNLLKIIETAQSSIAAFVKAVDPNNHLCEFSYELRAIKELIAYFRDHLPIHEGDRVRIFKQPQSSLDPSSEWYHHRKTLEVGSIGTVKSVEFVPGFPDFCPPRTARVCYYVEFDNEYYHDTTSGNVHKSNSRHVWGLTEADIETLPIGPDEYQSCDDDDDPSDYLP